MNDNQNNTTGIAGNALTSTVEQTHFDASTIDKIGALSLAASAIQEINGTTHLVIPEGFRHIDLTASMEKAGEYPKRKTGTVHLGDLSSFNVYVADQGESYETYIFADPDARTLTAVLNEHDKGDNHAGWRDFRAVYKAELSREFTNWLNANKKVMEQEEFAIFLEDNIADVVEPSGETLLQVALTLQAKTEVQFSSHKRLDNGQVQFTYNEVVEARAGGSGMIEIPREFTIGLRLFKNGEGYKIRARLKYRLHGSKLKFWFELDREQNAIEDAFQAYVDLARENGFTVLIGKP